MCINSAEASLLTGICLRVARSCSVCLSTHTGVESIHLFMDAHQKVLCLVSIQGNRGQVVMEIETRPETGNQLQTVSDENQLGLHLERETGVNYSFVIG